MAKTVAQISDLHINEKFIVDLGVKALENWKTVLDNIKERNIKNIVFTGDIGTPESNKWFFDSLNASGLDYRVILGNHDFFSEAIKHYGINLPKERKELYYLEEDPDFIYLYLDSSTGKISEDQLSWFKRAIQSNKELILFIHHPVLETGTTPQKAFPLNGSKEIKNALVELNKKVYIFCGHLHFRHEITEGNITQNIVPALSYQLKKHSPTPEPDNLTFGYRILEIGKNEVKTEVVMF